MAIDFPPNAANPNSPSNGDTYVDSASGTEWEYNATNNSWTIVNSSAPGGGAFVYIGEHDFTQAAVPSPPADAGYVYSQSDIGNAPGNVNSAYTGIAGDTIIEGTLVLYTGSSWTFMSTTPGYPNLGDGNGDTLDTRYVRTKGDDVNVQTITGDAGLKTEGLLQCEGGTKVRTIEFTGQGGANRFNYRGIGFSGSDNTLDINNHPDNEDENVIVIQSKAHLIDSEKNDVNAGNLTSFRARTHTSQDRTLFTGATGLAIDNLARGSNSTEAGWSGDNNVYGIYSGIVDRTVAGKTGKTYNIFADGTAPNYFAGKTTVSNASDFEYNSANNSNEKGTSISSSGYLLNRFYDDSTNACGPQFTRFGNSSIGDSTHNIAIFKYGDKSVNSSNTLTKSIQMDGAGDMIFTGATSDYRAKENIVDLPSAVDVIKAIRPVNFNFTWASGKTRPGFIAHELQEHLPVAVIGTKDATEAIGTLTDYDGTVLETEVTEPSAEELTYTEEVETDGVATMVTRTKTWSATGTRDVYQGVDQTKLIPLLTKALQEALERIEALEAAAGSSY